MSVYVLIIILSTLVTYCQQLQSSLHYRELEGVCSHLKAFRCFPLMMSGISVEDRTVLVWFFTHTECVSVNESISRGVEESMRRTEPGSLELLPLSLHRLLDHSLSGTVETTLTTFDPIHQVDLLQFRVEPLQVPAEKQGNRTNVNRAEYMD